MKLKKVQSWKKNDVERKKEKNVSVKKWSLIITKIGSWINSENDGKLEKVEMTSNWKSYSADRNCKVSS